MDEDFCEDCGRIDARRNECSTGPCGHHTLAWEMGDKEPCGWCGEIGS